MFHRRRWRRVCQNKDVLTPRWGVGQKLFSSLVAHSRTKDRMSLAFALCGFSALRSWTAARPALRVVPPSRSEGNRTRRWRMAGTSDQKNADGRLSAVAAEASTWSWNRSSGARRRSSADLTWSMAYRNRLARCSAAARARFPRTWCVLDDVEKKWPSACVCQW